MRSDVSIATIEDYWDAQPCNSKHGTAPIGTREWSEQVTARKFKVEPHILRFAQHLRWKGKVVTEIGCGIGTDTLEFARAGAKKIYALDLSAESIRMARSRLPVRTMWGSEDDNISFICANAEEWIPPIYCDLVYSFGVLHHTPHPELILGRAHKYLKPGGELRVMLYAKWSIKNLTRQQPEAQDGCPLARTYSVEEARNLIESCNFEIVSVEKAHIFPYRIADYVQHRYVKHWYYRAMPRRVFEWLESILGWHLLIVAKRAA